MDLGIKIALGLDGFSDAEIAEIDKALPGAQRLLATLRQILPIVQKEMPDLLADIPAADIILQHAKGTTT